MKGYIYMHIMPNNKVYIGQTTQRLEDRFLNGKGYSRCSLFQKAINKYGWESVRHKILFQVEGGKEDVLQILNKKEDEFIIKHKANDPEFGYNLRRGGENKKHSLQSIELMKQKQRGKKHTEETKKKMSTAKKGKNNPNYGRVGKLHPMYKKHHTEQARQSISKNLSGDKNYQSIAYELYNENGDLVYFGNSYQLRQKGFIGQFRHCANPKGTHKYARDNKGNKYIVRKKEYA